MLFFPRPEGDDCKDAGVRATHGAVAVGWGRGLNNNKETSCADYLFFSC